MRKEVGRQQTNTNTYGQTDIPPFPYWLYLSPLSHLGDHIDGTFVKGGGKSYFIEKDCFHTVKDGSSFPPDLIQAIFTLEEQVCM